jgi:phage terminase large subunit
MDAWRYLERGGKHCELVWHRRSGKDEVSLHHTACAAHERVGNYWYMLPQANQARKAVWEAINPHTGKRRIDEAFPKELRAATLEHEMLIKFKVGSAWQVVGSDNFNSLVGSPPIGMVFSEWPLCDPAAWAYLMPILEENGGWAIFNGTPRGKNHAFRSLKAAQKRKDAFGQVLAADSTAVFTAKQLERVKETLVDTYGEEYGAAVFEQEYLVSFDAANLGAILGRWLARADRDGRISDEHSYDPEGSPIEISSDIGRRDASAWWFWQPALGGFRVVDFDLDSGLDADEWCDRLEKLIEERGYTLGRIWLPHDARARTFAAKHSAVEIFIRRFGADKVRVVPDSSKEDRINAARKVIRSCAFHETRTAKGRDGLSAWCYEYNEERKEFSKEPRHDWASHPGDAFSYGAQVMRERVVEPQPEAPRVPGMPIAKPMAKPKVVRPTLDELWEQREQYREGRI